MPMGQPACRHHECVRARGHHVACQFNGRRKWRGDPKNPTCPADPTVLVRDCARCQAELAAERSTSQPTEMEV
jgi:hypothetical protein